MALRAVTEAESREIVHVAMSPIVNFPVASDHPSFPAQPIDWSDIFTNTPTTKGDVHKNIVTAAVAVVTNCEEGKLSESGLNGHIEQNDPDTAGGLSAFLQGSMAVKVP